MMNKYEEREKYYLKLLKRQSELEEQRRKLPYRDLKEPIHSGWFLEINLTERELKSKHGAQLNRALILSRREFITWEVKKISKIRENRSLAEIRKLFTTSTFFKKYYRGPGLITFDEKKFKKEIPEDLHKWFRKINKTFQGQITVEYKLDITDDKLICKVRKRILTRVQDINPKLESEIEWLEQKLKIYWITRKGANAYNRKSKTWASGAEKIQCGRKHIKENITFFLKGEMSGNDITTHGKAGKNKMLIK